MKNGIELRNTTGKGEGVFATKPFKAGDTVMVGLIDRIAEGNHSHASQIAENRFVIFASLANKINDACDPNCGIRVSKMGAHHFVARRDIRANEEITADYAMWNYTIEHFPANCGRGVSPE